MTAPCPTDQPTSPIPGNDTSLRGAVTLLREVLRKIEAWQVSLRGGNLTATLEDMGETGCMIDDFLEDFMKHTKEPWAVRAIGSEGYNVGREINATLLALPIHQRLRESQPICRVDGFEWETLKANAHRIVACVNACKGINPEAVPDLLEALKMLYNDCMASDFNEHWESYKLAEAAISRTKP